MSEHGQVWDLGDLDGPTAARPTPVVAAASSGAERRSGAPRASRRSARGVDWVPALAFPLPGLPSILRGRLHEGLLIASGLGLMASLAWAVSASLDRLGNTLHWLGLPEAAAVWALGAFAALAVGLHVAAVAWSRPEGFGAPPPPVSAFASALVPGWGQILNGDAIRAALFLTAAWTVVALWVLASPGLGTLLEARNLILPAFLETAASAPVRFAATAAVWSVAVHDAGIRAAWIRS